MNNQDFKYTELINRIKSHQPTPENPDALTSEILDKIGKLSSKPASLRSLKFVVLISSTAAALLFGLFLSDLSSGSFSETIVAPKHLQTVHIKIEAKSENTLDKINAVIYDKREARKQKELFYTNLANRYQNF